MKLQQVLYTHRAALAGDHACVAAASQKDNVMPGMATQCIVLNRLAAIPSMQTCNP